MRLGGLEGGDGRRPRGVGDERQLPEGFAEAPDGECGGLPERRRDADREATLGDQVERVRGVAFVEHDLAAAERAATRHREHPTDFLGREITEEFPVHQVERTPLLSRSRAAGDWPRAPAAY